MATPEHQRVIDLWNNGLSMGGISKEINFTRGQIAGILYRARRRGEAVKANSEFISKPVIPKATKKVKAIMDIIDEAPKPKPIEITIYRLRDGQCKYPTLFSEDNEQLFCAKPTDKTYCSEHHALCHTWREPLKFKNYRKLGR